MQCYRPVHPVKALTFDLDDTLYNNEPIIQQADAALNQKIRNDYPALSAMTNDDWFTIKRALINKNPKLASDMGKLRWQTLFTALGKAQLPDTERAQAVSELFDFFYAARSDFQVEPDIIAVMEKLAEKVPLVAITNGNVDTDMIGLAPFFSLTLHASVTRPRKHAMKEQLRYNGPKNIHVFVADSAVKKLAQQTTTQHQHQFAWRSAIYTV